MTRDIPKNTPYCYDSFTNNYCPYHKEGINGELEYCSMIKCELLDSIKSCGISRGRFFDKKKEDNGKT